jgi:hypothetical protein
MPKEENFLISLGVPNTNIVHDAMAIYLALENNKI